MATPMTNERTTERDELVERLCALTGVPGMRHFLKHSTVGELRDRIAQNERAAELIRRHGRMGAEAQDDAW